MLNIDNNVLFIFTFRNIFIKHAKENIFVSSSRKLISLSSFSLSPHYLSSLSLSLVLTLGGACLVHLAPYDPHIQTPDGVFSFFWTLLLSWPNLDASVAAKLWNIMIISEFVCNVQYFIIRWHICQSFNA